ncbi:hypothetical protein D3C74_393040 [compost metagenome]
MLTTVLRTPDIARDRTATMSYQSGTSSPSLRWLKLSSVTRYPALGRSSSQTTSPAAATVTTSHVGAPAALSARSPTIQNVSTNTGSTDSPMLSSMGR